MPIARLVNLLFGRSGGSVAKPALVFEQGTIQLIQGNGVPLVSTKDGRVVTASPTTDEVLREGDRVWLSKTESGTYIMHGGVR